MAVTKQLSRTLAACLVACAAAALVALFSPVRALAEQTGNLTVTPTDGASTALDAYQLFSADVTDVESGHKILSNISWASDAAEKVVPSAIRSVDPSYGGTTAQDAADWLGENVEGDAASAPTASSAPAAIARALAGETPTARVTAGEQTTLAAGYWLLVADGDSVGTGQSGTAAILVAVGGADATATTKASAPTVEKHVLEDSSDSWQKQADATVGDELDWRLSATVPVDLSSGSAYKTYSLTFHDEPSAGLERPGNVRVYVAPAGTAAWAQGSEPGDGWVELDKGEYATPDATGGSGLSFDVSVADLIASAAIHGVVADAGLEVCVTYDAPLTQAAARGVEHGNPNTVTLEYPASPYTDARGETQEDEAIAYTWDLDLVKRSSVDQRRLAGAVLRVTDDRGRHLTQEGTWTEDDATVTTGQDGTVAASGVDSGTFKVEEVAAPAGYVGITGALEVRLRVSLEADRISHHLEQASDPDDLNPGEWRLVATSPLSLDSFDPDASGVATAYVPNAPEGTTPPSQGGGTGGAVGEALRRVLPRTPSTGDPTSYVPAICLAVVGVALIAFAVRRMRGGTRRRH